MILSITRSELAAAIGVVAFALAGIGAGLAIKPAARELIGPEGPQTVAPVSGQRIQATSGSAFANYKYGIPDYVIGTDWLQPDLPEEAPAAEVEAYEPPPYVPQRFISVPDRAPAPDYAPPPRRYPSIGGDIYAVAPDAPEPQQPPEPPEPPEAPERPPA
ncbi:MAG: hypothetical protein Q8Q88_07915 [Phenylobacterium sp.]|uniref:hypothetical protein n=1 Tax=Phenylobacterium sp. TaxID=1871053 RepID=UPI002733304E|nr:hypothetical protein [Phenylobacterium sp.]MDP3746961.1 hypothetical protein [Phenylobacterium sp.]